MPARRFPTPEEEAFIREFWRDRSVTLRDLETHCRASAKTLYVWAHSLGLGYRNDCGAPNRLREREEATDGYAGRRYEDDPRDPPSTVPVRMPAPMIGSVVGNSGEMCAIG